MPTRTQHRRRWPGRLVKTGTVLTALFLVASVVGARVAVAGSREAFAVPPDRIGHHYADVTFASRGEHLALSGWLFHADRPSGRSVILVHGWQGNREDVDFVPLARRLLAHGYDVLMFDLRGSGLSGGAHQTLGHDEPRDLLGAYDFMVSRGYAPGEMTVLGNSMGAATVIEAAPQLAQVGALVCDSAFADLSSSMQGAVRLYTHLPGLVAVPAMEMSRAFGVLPSLRPVQVVASLPDRAFLFLHARGDRLLDISNAHELLSASPDPASRLVVLGGHEHLDTFLHNRARYMRVLLAFVDTQLGTPTPGH